MIIVIAYSQRQDTKSGHWLRCNLEDIGYSLNKYLRRHHQAQCTYAHSPGRLTITTAAARDIVEPLIQAFRTAMDRDGLKILVSYQAQPGTGDLFAEAQP